MAANNIRSRMSSAKGKTKGALRKAGDRLKGMAQSAGRKAREFDDAYSNKIMGMYDKAPDSVAMAAAMVGGGSPSTRKFDPGLNENPSFQEKAMGAAMTYGVPAANAVTKYALPAAGVTLAGKGLIDIGTALAQPGMDEQQTSGTMMPN